MKWFRWFRKEKAEQPGQSDYPQVGQSWRLINRDGDPFGPKYKPIQLREVRDGWVRYDIGEMFPDQRRPVSEFVSMYRRVES